MLRALPLLAALALSGEPATASKRLYDFAATPTIEQLRAVKLLPVPAGVTAHAVEERGFVSVPMDYTRRSESPTLRIFYRLMPARGTRPRDTKAPILVVVNGGPALASSRLRPYDYDEARPTEEMRKNDRLGEMLSRFRVLILDQRGTGNSAPLDMSDPLVDPVVVARYFDSAHIALDHQEVIRTVVPEGEPFYMLLHSYAGRVGMRYVTMPSISRHPRGLVFASSALPHQDVVHAFEARRMSQRALNLQLLRALPDLKTTIARLRAHFGGNGLDRGSVNYLWTWLGKGPPGQWEPVLRDQVNALLAADREGLEKFLEREADKADLLNYILSAKELTPGFTDRTLGALLVRRVPFEGWTSTRLQGDARWIDPVLDAIDRGPPPEEPPFPSVEEIRRRLAALHTLFIFGKGDAYIGEDAPRRAKVYAVEGRTRTEVLPGGHWAVYLATGVEAISAWIASLPRPVAPRHDR
jgi:pimeloyl-ACP methyl ester carboxylesterase